jgi:eukaryotic-like serine/threonine-protein kinase
MPRSPGCIIFIAIGAFLSLVLAIILVLSLAGIIPAVISSIALAIFAEASLILSAIQLIVDAGVLRRIASAFIPQQNPSAVTIRRALNRTRAILILVTVFLFLALIPEFYSFVIYPNYESTSCNINDIVKSSGNIVQGIFHQDGLQTTREPDGECVGISDGTSTFDTLRLDGNHKLSAATYMRNNDVESAINEWQMAHKQESDDAEPLIYQADQQVLVEARSQQIPYIDVVVVTMLTGSEDSVKIGRDDLQGAYTEQEEFNKTGTLNVRLLVANVGDSSKNSDQIATQIEQIEQNDNNFVGVMGWPMSASPAIEAIKSLSLDHINQISPTASDDELSYNIPYFFRVNPSNRMEAEAGANYAVQYLNTRRILVFADKDPADHYSQNLANDFTESKVLKDCNCYQEVQYEANDPTGLAVSVTNEVSTYAPTMIYFAGYAQAATVLFNTLHNLKLTTIPILGGDALYQLRSSFFNMYLPTADNLLHFTAFAYPDDAKLNSSTFSADYTIDYGANSQESAGPYGFTRADNDAILSYDALQTLLKNETNGKILKAQDLQSKLSQIDQDNAIPGASGPIYFSSTNHLQSSDPINKPVLVICVRQDGTGYVCA